MTDNDKALWLWLGAGGAGCLVLVLAILWPDAPSAQQLAIKRAIQDFLKELPAS